MSITREEMEVCRATARRRDQERKAKLEARRARAWELARQAAQILKSEFGASRVVIFGSLLQPGRFHSRSDIDLAAWDVRNYFRALASLHDLDPEFGFDLVPIEDAKPYVLAAIGKEGVEL